MFFWGDPQPYVADAHRHGVKVFLQVGSVEEAKAAAAAGLSESGFGGRRSVAQPKERGPMASERVNQIVGSGLYRAWPWPRGQS